MTETFRGGGYVPSPELPESPTTGIPVQRDPERPDPFYVAGMQCAVQMFAPLDPTRAYEQYEIDVWWTNITTYADGVAAYLRSRTGSG